MRAVIDERRSGSRREGLRRKGGLGFGEEMGEGAYRMRETKTNKWRVILLIITLKIKKQNLYIYIYATNIIVMMVVKFTSNNHPLFVHNT